MPVQYEEKESPQREKPRCTQKSTERSRERTENTQNIHRKRGYIFYVRAILIRKRAWKWLITAGLSAAFRWSGARSGKWWTKHLALRLSVASAAAEQCVAIPHQRSSNGSRLCSVLQAHTICRELYGPHEQPNDRPAMQPRCPPLSPATDIAERSERAAVCCPSSYFANGIFGFVARAKAHERRVHTNVRRPPEDRCGGQRILKRDARE